MTVHLQSASGNVLSVFIAETCSENYATRVALRKVNRENPGAKYMALRCEHGRKVIR